MPPRQPSEWPLLFDIATQIFHHVESQIGFPPAWSFGGGTALMLQIDYRESHDIDLFLDDPQLLPYLNSKTQAIPLSRRPNSYSVERATVLKLAYKDAGEIDFICCGNITDNSTHIRAVREQQVALETPAVLDRANRQ